VSGNFHLSLNFITAKESYLTGFSIHFSFYVNKYSWNSRTVNGRFLFSRVSHMQLIMHFDTLFLSQTRMSTSIIFRFYCNSLLKEALLFSINRKGFDLHSSQFARDTMHRRCTMFRVGEIWS